MKEEQLIEWMEQFSFDALQPEQQRQVLEHMSSEEYNFQREALVGAQQLFEDEAVHLNPDPAIKSAALASWTSDEKVPWYVWLLNYRIPAYSLVVPMLIIGVVWAWFQVDNGTVEFKVGPQVVETVVRDTVLMEVEKPVEVIVERTVEVPTEVIRYVDRPVEQGSIAVVDVPGSFTSNRDLSGEVDRVTQIASKQMGNVGSDASESAELNQFVVSTR